MSYKSLYDFCQNQEIPISGEHLILPKVLELTGIGQIKTVYSGSDPALAIRGLFLSIKNKEHKIAQQHGCNVIVLSRELLKNRCWRRFIYVKELMHLFDKNGELASTPEAYENILTELSGVIKSDETKSEINAMWMTLAALCPEKIRLAFEQQREAGHIDNYGIALQLRIPQLYVPGLFHPKYRNIIDSLLN